MPHHFNGTNDYIDIPNTLVLNPKKITVSTWFNPAVWSGGVEGRLQDEAPGLNDENTVSDLYYYVKDHLGSTRLTVEGNDANFSPVEATLYDSYGVMTEIGATAGTAFATGVAAAGTGMTMAGTVVGAAYPAAQVITDASYINRIFTAPNFDMSLNIISDYFTGGSATGTLGNSLGLLNLMSSGSGMDWYKGYVVYSGGVAGDVLRSGGASGSEYFGPAIFVTTASDRRVVAHEIRHVQQMSMIGNRLYYDLDYWVNNNYQIGSDYSGNPYEIDAEFYGYEESIGKLDIYGQGTITQEMIDDYRYWYSKDTNPYGKGVWDFPANWQPWRQY